MKISEVIKNPSTKIVDVRTIMEYESGHVKNALNIPLDQIQDRFREIEGLGAIPVVFYCRSGNRSVMAVNLLHQLGIENIHNGGTLEDIQYHLN